MGNPVNTLVTRMRDSQRVLLVLRGLFRATRLGPVQELKITALVSMVNVELKPHDPQPVSQEAILS